MNKVNTQRLQKSKTLDLVYAAIGVTLITICSWINIPMAVPFTLQTFAVFAVLLILGGERGTIATLIYVPSEYLYLQAFREVLVLSLAAPADIS